MNEKLPYEDQLDQAWDTLPLPDEDMAWKDMKRRLDEDDDDRIVVPPPRGGCGIGALLIGLLLLGGLWFLLRPEKWFTKKETETAQQTKSGTKEDKTKENKTEVKIEDKDETKIKNNNTPTQSDTANINSITKNYNEESSNKVKIKNPDTKRSEPLTIKDKVAIQTNDPKIKKKQAKPQPVKRDKPKDDPKTQSKKVQVNEIDNEESVSNQKKKNDVDNRLSNDIPIQQKDSVNDTKSPRSQINDLQVTDSTKNKTNQPTFPKKDSVIKNNNVVKQKDKEKKPIFFSAGLGLHQQIPIAGQEWTTYSSLGRKGIISDYIPSINFRMEKQDRWFLQTEFRYGAPQHTKQFTYDQITTFDTATQSSIITSKQLRKTFYHQVPLTFNYYVLPKWSIGTGIQWNRFYSAVAEEDIRKRRPGTNADSLISQKVVKINADSAGALARSWFQGVVQTQYQWKRFSIGARYSFGLNPYIKFSLPNQPFQQEKNNSFQIFLRYELWRSKKK